MPLAKLALRSVFRHRLRSAITISAVAAGVVGLILSGGFIHDIFTQLGEAIIHSQTGHLQISRAGFHDLGARRPEQYRLHDENLLEARVAAIPGVREVMARIRFSGLLNNGRSDLAIIGEGMEPDREARLGTFVKLLDGRRLAAGDLETVMVGAGVARSLHLVPGDHVTVMANTDAGALNTVDLTVVGVFQTFSRDYDAHAILVPLSAAAEILGSHDVNTVVVALTRTADTDTMAKRLHAMFASSGLEIRTWAELSEFYAKTVALYDRQFGVLRIVILLMVLLSVANSVNMSMFERTAEFGTMRALGDHKGLVARLILAEVTLLGVIGASIGVALGILFAAVISAVGIPMPPPPNSDLSYIARVRVVPTVVVGAFMIGVVASVLAGIPAALRMPRIPVIDALRRAV